MAAEEYSKRFIHPDDRAMVRKSAEINRSGEDPEFLVDIEHRVIRRDGEVRCILSRTRGFRDVEGHVTRCYGANQDITERKRLEDRLLQAQKMETIGTLSAGIAHDFKNILMAIEGFANLGIKGSRNESKQSATSIDPSCRRAGQGPRRADLTFSQKSEDEPKPTELIPVSRRASGCYAARCART